MTALSLNRCICVHSMSQIVDIVFQNLLFQRQFISEPMQQLKKYEPNCKAVTEYERICDCLRSLFKASNSRRLREIVVIVGATPYLAKELYRIFIHFCENHANSIDKGCGDKCGQLSDNEMRKVFIMLRDTFPHDDISSNGNRKVFIYARVSKPLYNASETDEIEEDDGFELPKKILSKEIRVRYCREENTEENDKIMVEENNENGLWLRFTPFFTTHI